MKLTITCKLITISEVGNNGNNDNNDDATNYKYSDNKIN